MFSTYSLLPCSSTGDRERGLQSIHHKLSLLPLHPSTHPVKLVNIHLKHDSCDTVVFLPCSLQVFQGKSAAFLGCFLEFCGTETLPYFHEESSRVRSENRFSEVWRATEVKIQWIASSSGLLSFICWISLFSKRIFISMSAAATSSVLILL